MLRSRLLRSLYQAASTSYSAAHRSAFRECLHDVCYRGGPAYFRHTSDQFRQYANKRRLQEESFVVPEDEEEELELDTLRRHNSSILPLKGRRIFAKVIRAEKKFIYIDPGYKKFLKLPRKVLKLWDVVFQSTDPTPRASPDDFRVGDKLILTIEEVEGPFGDMILAPDVPQKDDLHDMVWQEMAELARKGEPVMGRVLNDCPGGHAIGIAGFVVFCPSSQMSWDTAKRVGVLQPFYIDRMRPDIKNVVVADAATVEKRLRMVQLYQRNQQNRQALKDGASGPSGPAGTPESGGSPLRSPFGAIQAPRGFVRRTPGSDQ